MDIICINSTTNIIRLTFCIYSKNNSFGTGWSSELKLKFCMDLRNNKKTLKIVHNVISAKNILKEYICISWCNLMMNRMYLFQNSCWRQKNLHCNLLKICFLINTENLLGFVAKTFDTKSFATFSWGPDVA